MKAQRGYTLTELILVLGVGGIILGGAFAAYRSASTDTMDQQITVSLLQMVTSIRNKWSTTGSYASVTNDNVSSAGLVPTTFKVDTSTAPDTINHGYSGTITTDTTGTGGTADTTQFRTAITNVPAKLCSDIVVALNNISYDIRIGGTAAGDAVKTAAAPTLDVSATMTKCAPGSVAIYGYTR